MGARMMMGMRPGTWRTTRCAPSLGSTSRGHVIRNWPVHSVSAARSSHRSAANKSLRGPFPISQLEIYPHATTFLHTFAALDGQRSFVAARLAR